MSITKSQCPLTDVEQNIGKWKEMYDSPEPDKFKYPAPFDSLIGLDKMVVLRTLRPDKMVPAVQVCSVEIISRVL